MISTTLLVSIGVPPAAASAGVHTVEVFTTGTSGISHILHRNVDWRLLARLAIPGIIGGVLGAYVLTQIDASTAKPFVLTYLAAIGLFLIWRGSHYPPEHKPARVVEPLGLAGGFLDAAGGGGWGPVVTGNLLAQGTDPRRTIGTVNTAEFLVTVCISATFIVDARLGGFHGRHPRPLIGGVAAAPLGAWAVKVLPPKALLVLVGILLTLTSLYGVYRAVA